MSNEDFDQSRLWQTLGELKAGMIAAAKQRDEMIADIKALREDQDKQRRDHDRLIHTGAAVKAWIFSN
jgi:hypothetical protein